MSDAVSHVVEGYLLEGLWSAFHSVVEWFQDREHGLHIVLPEVHPGGERGATDNHQTVFRESEKEQKTLYKRQQIAI